MNMRIGPPVAETPPLVFSDDTQQPQATVVHEQLNVPNPEVDACLDKPTRSCLHEMAEAYSHASVGDAQFEINRLAKKGEVAKLVDALYFSESAGWTNLWSRSNHITKNEDRALIMDRLATLPDPERRAVQEAINSNEDIQSLSQQLRDEFSLACYMHDAAQKDAAELERSKTLDPRSTVTPLPMKPPAEQSKPAPPDIESNPTVANDRKEAMRVALTVLPKPINGNCPNGSTALVQHDTLWDIARSVPELGMTYKELATLNKLPIIQDDAGRDVVILPTDRCLAMPERWPTK